MFNMNIKRHVLAAPPGYICSKQLWEHLNTVRNQFKANEKDAGMISFSDLAVVW